MNEIHAGKTREFCPICHRPIGVEDACEWVPVCPLVYPDVEGLRCHSSCLEQERERNRFLRPEDLRPTFLRHRFTTYTKEGR